MIDFRSFQAGAKKVAAAGLVVASMGTVLVASAEPAQAFRGGFGGFGYRRFGYGGFGYRRFGYGGFGYRRFGYGFGPALGFGLGYGFASAGYGYAYGGYGYPYGGYGGYGNGEYADGAGDGGYDGGYGGAYGPQGYRIAYRGHRGQFTCGLYEKHTRLQRQACSN